MGAVPPPRRPPSKLYFGTDTAAVSCLALDASVLRHRTPAEVGSVFVSVLELVYFDVPGVIQALCLDSACVNAEAHDRTHRDPSSHL